MGSTPRGVSGSRIAAILGLSDYQSPFEVAQALKEECYPGYAAAHGMTLPPPVDNAAIRFGTAFEDAIVSLSEKATGMPIACREQSYERDFLTCHIDGLYMHDMPGEITLYEGKSTTVHSFHDAWGDPGTDRVPQGYQCQAQHNMALSGCERCRLSVLVFPRRPEEWEAEGWIAAHIGSPKEWWLTNEKQEARPISWARTLAEMGFFHLYDIAINRDAVRLMHEAAAHFWAHYVVGAELPDPRTYDDVRRAFPQPKGTIVADEQTARWASEYKAIGEEIGGTGRLARRREELKVLILNWMRAQDATLDDESRERTVLRDSTGGKLASFDGKTFRT